MYLKNKDSQLKQFKYEQLQSPYKFNFVLLLKKICTYVKTQKKLVPKYFQH